MFYPHSRSFRQFKSIANSFVQGDGLPLRDVLAEGVIDRIAADEGVCFGSTFTTALVLWAFVTQAISKDQTCLAAVARIISVLVGSGREACSSLRNLERTGECVRVAVRKRVCALGGES